MLLADDAMDGLRVKVGEAVTEGETVAKAVGAGVAVYVPVPLPLAVPVPVPDGVKEGVRV